MATNAIKRYLATHQSRVEKALGDAMAATLSEQPDDPLSFIANHLTSAPKSSSAADLIAGWAEGLPATRDLTDAGETARVLEIATEMIKSGLPIEDFKAACYGDAEGKGAGPTVLVSAVGSAESKLKMKTVGGFHLTCIFAMYGEQNRIQTKAGHKNGQDFIRMKVKQLDWLFEGEDASKSWEILAVDDGCPHDSKTLARKIISDEGYKNVSVLDLEDAVRDGVAFFAERGLKAGCKESRKGGAILYGLHTAASRAAAAGNAAVPALAMYTDSDLSTDMSLCGLLAAGVLAKDARMSMGARYGAPGTFLVKPPDFGPSGHPLSHFEQPNMMKIVFRHCAPPGAIRRDSLTAHPPPPHRRPRAAAADAPGRVRHAVRVQVLPLRRPPPHPRRGALARRRLRHGAAALRAHQVLGGAKGARRGSLRRVADALHRGLRRVELHGERRRRGQAVRHGTRTRQSASHAQPRSSP